MNQENHAVGTASATNNCGMSKIEIEPNDKLFVKSAEAAAMLSIGHSTFRKYVKAKRLPAPVTSFGHPRWRVTDLKAVGTAPPATGTTNP